MANVEILKKKVKQYIDKADENVVKMVHAMLEENAKHDWWDELPENLKKSINKSLTDLDKGKGISHEEVKKIHPEWFSK